MRNTVRFNAEGFNTTDQRDYFINPTCFGDDLGHWLKPRLVARGYDVDGPGQEDWGWYLTCRAGGRSVLVGIGYTGDPDAAWLIFIEPRRTLADRLLARPDLLAPRVARDLHAVLCEAAETRVTEWVAVDGRGRESDSAPVPV